MVELFAARDLCFQEARKSTTRKTYSAGVNLFFDLKDQLNWTKDDEEGLVELTSIFVGFLVKKRAALGTVKVYLHGIRAHYLDSTMGTFNPCDSYRIQMCVRGAARILKDIPSPKLAFLIEFLLAIKIKMSGDFIDSRDWAALTTGFFGLLRKAELLAIRWRDIRKITDGAKIFIPESKTDPNSKGVFVHVASRTDPLCPVSALVNLASFLNPDSRADNIFVFATTRNKSPANQPLSHNAFVKRIKKWIAAIGLDPKEYSGHSLRRGGATALIRAGVSPELVQLQGRWRSDAYRLYVQRSSEQLLAITRAIPAL